MDFLIVIFQLLFIIVMGIFVALFSAYMFWAIISGRIFYSPPVIPTSKDARKVMFDLLDKHVPDINKKPYRFIDIGCGYGTLTFHAAKKYPHSKSTGVDFSMIAFLFSKIRCHFFKYKNVDIIYSNYFKLNLSSYDVAFCYLYNLENQRVGQKLLKDLKPGSFVVSNTFPFKDWEPLEVAAYDDVIVKRDVYIYQITKEMKANEPKKAPRKKSAKK